MDEEIKEKETEEAPAEKAADAEVKIDKNKALKNWFKKESKGKEKKEELFSSALANKPKKANGDGVKHPINWKRVRLIFVYTLAILILAASVATNGLLYKKYKALKNKPAETTMCVAQEKNNGIDKEKIEKMAAQIDKLSAMLNLNGEAQETAKATADANQAENKTNVIKVAIYNGTTTVGLAREMGKTLKEKMSEVEVVALDNAKHNNYAKTSVVALGGKTAEAQKIAQAIGGQFNIFPLDEVKPADADVLVVVGK